MLLCDDLFALNLEIIVKLSIHATTLIDWAVKTIVCFRVGTGLARARRSGPIVDPQLTGPRLKARQDFRQCSNKGLRSEVLQECKRKAQTWSKLRGTFQRLRLFQARHPKLRLGSGSKYGRVPSPACLTVAQPRYPRQSRNQSWAQNFGWNFWTLAFVRFCGFGFKF